MTKVFPTAKNHCTTLLRITGVVDTEERDYINANHHGGSFHSVTGMGDVHCHPRVVRILTWDCRIKLNSPILVLPRIQSDYVREETWLTDGILLANASKECVLSTQELHNSRCFFISVHFL